MVWSVFEYENKYITATKEKVGSIPFLKFRPRGYDGLLPTVINYHGWHSSKEFKRFESLTIASHGYQVIAPDALYHGDRDPIDHDDPDNLNRYLWEIILQSVTESQELIEHIVDCHEADSRRIGIIGDSMGTITAGGVFTANPGLKCLVGLNGTFAWQEAIRRNCLPEPSSENITLVEKYDPVNNINSINGRDILMLHGIDDTSVPIECQKFFYDKAFPLCDRNPGNMEFIEVSNINHRITTGMLERSVMWFKEHL